MKNRTYIYAQHGWGFESSIWRTWLPYLPPAWTMETGERGYFGAATMDKPFWSVDETSRRMVVSHSFGLHLVSPEILRATDVLVIVSGFKHFHLSVDAASVRAVRRMLARIKTDVPGLLDDFYNQCFGRNSFEPARPKVGKSISSVQSVPPIPLIVSTLARDLELLNTSSLSISELSRIPLVIVLHGDADEVVPPVHGIQLGELLNNSQLHIRKGARHSLPFTNPQWCIERIQETLEDERLNRLLYGSTGQSLHRETPLSDRMQQITVEMVRPQTEQSSPEAFCLQPYNTKLISGSYSRLTAADVFSGHRGQGAVPHMHYGDFSPQC